MENINHYCSLEKVIQKHSNELLLKRSFARKSLAFFKVKDSEKSGKIGRKIRYTVPLALCYGIEAEYNNLSEIETLDRLKDVIHEYFIFPEEIMFFRSLNSRIKDNYKLKHEVFNFKSFLNLMSAIHKPDKCLISKSAWSEFIADKEIMEYFIPTPSFSQVEDGYTGELLGISIYTDALRVLNFDVSKLKPHGVNKHFNTLFLNSIGSRSVYMLPSSIELGGIVQKESLSVSSIFEEDKFKYWHIFIRNGMEIITDNIAVSEKLYSDL